MELNRKPEHIQTLSIHNATILLHIQWLVFATHHIVDAKFKKKNENNKLDTVTSVEYMHLFENYFCLYYILIYK